MSTRSNEHLSEFPVVIDWPVQWGDEDSFGHVNNTVFLRWFESARVAFLQRIGLAARIRSDGLGPILAAVHCNYRRQLKYPDTVQIGARVGRIGESSATIDHVVVSRRLEAIVADGQSVVVYLDYRANQPVRIPDDIRQTITDLQRSAERSP
jgi:acyl-CoA thioester hydrolase